MILYDDIGNISKNLWIGYMMKNAFLLASSIHVGAHPATLSVSQSRK